MLGIVNDLYDYFMKQISAQECSLTEKDLLNSHELDGSFHFGGNFNGNQCQAIILNIQRLIDALHDGGVYNTGAPISKSLQPFSKVRKTCFGMVIDDNYQKHINEFGKSFMEVGMNSTPKVHALLMHVPQFLEKYKYLGKGLGY